MLRVRAILRVRHSDTGHISSTIADNIITSIIIQIVLLVIVSEPWDGTINEGIVYYTDSLEYSEEGVTEKGTLSS